jgi:hypothetical protein
MTLPDERFRALQAAQRFMIDLTDSKKTPRLPKYIRDHAKAVLRHYPTNWDMKRIEELAPHIIQEHMEPLYKMVKERDLKLKEIKDGD